MYRLGSFTFGRAKLFTEKEGGNQHLIISFNHDVETLSSKFEIPSKYVKRELFHFTLQNGSKLDISTPRTCNLT